jgi:ankyrin repeat protein
MVSPIMQALYAGRRDEAVAMAADADLDQFEAAALGDAARLQEVVTADRGRAREWSDDGFTALHYAAYFGTPEAARILIAAGADVAAVAANDMRVQPLHSAAASASVSGSAETSRLLLEAGAPLDAQQTGGFTPLHEAALNADVPLIDVLLEHGADPGVRSDDGNSAADIARENGHDDIAARLEARLTP